MTERAIDSLTEAQRQLLAKLGEGYVLFEERAEKREGIRYILAQIEPEHPGAQWRRRCINKHTFFALLANGFLEKFRPWPGRTNEAYGLAEEKESP